MAVPKRKLSRSNTRARRSQWKAQVPELVTVVVDGREVTLPRRLVAGVRRGHVTLPSEPEGRRRAPDGPARAFGARRRVPPGAVGPPWQHPRVSAPTLPRRPGTASAARGPGGCPTSSRAAPRTPRARPRARARPRPGGAATRRVRLTLAALLVPALLVTLAGLVALWPAAADVPARIPVAAEGSTVLRATVTGPVDEATSEVPARLDAGSARGRRGRGATRSPSTHRPSTSPTGSTRATACASCTSPRPRARAGRRTSSWTSSAGCPSASSRSRTPSWCSPSRGGAASRRSPGSRARSSSSRRSRCPRSSPGRTRWASRS